MSFLYNVDNKILIFIYKNRIKIKEFAEKVVLLNARGEPRAGLATSASSASVSAPSKATSSKPTITKPSDTAAAKAAKPTDTVVKVDRNINKRTRLKKKRCFKIVLLV